MKVGEVKNFAFDFVNNSGTDIKIELATGSCGCTVPDAPARVFKPGDRGKIPVTYTGKADKDPGLDEQEVTVILENTDSEGYPIIQVLKVKAFVVK